MNRVRNHLKEWIRKAEHRRAFFSRRGGKRGQALIEYTLMIILVSWVVVLILPIFGGAISDSYCDIILTLQPEGSASCTKVRILNANYSSGSGKLTVTAKLPPGSSADLILVGYGPMERQGSSNVFKLEISVSPPPPSTVTVQSTDGGWLTADVN